jgi:hypothetical protein
MQSQYRLGGLGNDELLAALAGLARREHDLMSDLLAHLAELDERRLYLELGFSSLFASCTEALGFCKSAAGRRIAVARVCRRYPEAFARVARGELQLSVLSLLGQYLTSENATEVFDAVSREVYLRDDGRCTFCSTDGRRCGARRFLQLDHVTPWAVEGPSSVENLRLRCPTHNLHAARLYFGTGFIRKKQGRAPATKGAAALSSASRESTQHRASCAFGASPED